MPDATAPAALRALLDGLVDYAGLFPPAALPLDEAAARYAGYRAGADRLALGRFVVPAARLDALADAARGLGASARDPWPVSALVGDGGAELDAVRPYVPGAREPGALLVGTVEARAATPDEVRRVAERLPPEVAAYVEIPHAADPATLVAAIADAGLRAKIRTGGVAAGAFPTAAEVARFLVACRDEGVAFKATAGLHHPLRGSFPLTYEAGADRATMFGFLNVFVAALLVHEGADAEVAERALLEDDAAAFAFDDMGLSWRGTRVATLRVREGRGRFATSFGSCSFEEPVGEVRTLLSRPATGPSS